MIAYRGAGVISMPDGDYVVCALVDELECPTEGSIVVSCADCERPCWQAPCWLAPATAHLPVVCVDCCYERSGLRVRIGSVH